MAIEARKPPPQFAATMKRVLGGRSGLSGIAAQLIFVAVLIWVGYEIVANARANLEAQRIASGFGFLNNTAGFGVSQSLIPYAENDSYLRVFFVGLLNTLAVSVVGIFFATVIGFFVGLGRMSPNWLVARLCGAYVEIIRNLPLLFQLLFWYIAVLAALPAPRQSFSFFGVAFLSNRGLVVPTPIPLDGFGPFLIALLVAVIAAFGLRIYARRALFERGKVLTIWPCVLAILIGLPVLSMLAFGLPATSELPVLRGFNFSGGSRVVPEFVALVLALSTYTAAFIAEIVRAGVTSVHKGQVEAGGSLGLTRGQTLRLIVVPQALRVILPPLTNQYLNLTKNSSLAVAIGYPDLFSVFAGTALSQTGQAIEIIAMTMGVYLVISLVTSAIMNFYGWRLDQATGDAAPLSNSQLAIVGAIAFLSSLLLSLTLILGIPPYSIGFLIMSGLLITAWPLYFGLPALVVFLTLLLPRTAAIATSAAVVFVACATFIRMGIAQSSGPFLVALLVGGITAFSISAFRATGWRLGRSMA